MMKWARRRGTGISKSLATLGLLLIAGGGMADEAGVSIWIPGLFGSLSAVPGATGWSLTTLYYHSSVDADRGSDYPIGGRTAVGLNADIDLLFATPTYTFETPVFGAQAASGLVIPFGHVRSEADVTLTGPRGRTFELNPQDGVSAFGDMLSLNTLKWNDGENNYLAYGAVAIPTGDYEQGRLANTSTNHWGIDLGGGYTFLDGKNEFSATLGFTYNFENSDTDYKNGIDAHFEWAASHFVTATTHIGVVGYFFQQVSGDDGDGAALGDFKSRVGGIGPQIGHFFEASNRKFYVNLKGFYEFNASHRPEGWNTWLTLLIPLEAEKKN